MLNRKQSSSLFFVRPNLSNSSKGLLEHSKATALVEGIIATYFEVYVSPNLMRMKNKLKPELIVNILSQTSCDETTFNTWLRQKFGPKNNVEVKQLCNFLRRLVRGELTKKDVLIQSLIKANTIQYFTVAQYNWLISCKLSHLINDYAISELSYSNDKENSRQTSLRSSLTSS